MKTLTNVLAERKKGIFVKIENKWKKDGMREAER